VVVSGFHDSIGMYERSSPAEESSARELLEGLGLESLAERDFDALSGGQQRLLLLARAMVKAPELLVLDEPCQGLDPANRARILAMIDRIGDGAELIYVSHHRDELPRRLTHLLEPPARRAAAWRQAAKEGIRRRTLRAAGQQGVPQGREPPSRLGEAKAAVSPWPSEVRKRMATTYWRRVLPRWGWSARCSGLPRPGC
jgi:ATPase subunit of ABC transporter with duplicated ATPase domains